MSWNHDISQAPRGHMITVMRNTKTKDGIFRVPVEEFEPDILWLATICGKVIRSYWVPANGRHDGYWPGFAQKDGTPPVAWQPYVIPTHPNHQSDSGALAQAGVRGLASVKATAPLSDRDYVLRVGERSEVERELAAVAAATVSHLGLEDVGGGV
ncbi:hypothetical protein [Rhizobium rhizogenes]|uniref:hypothetical protein n=1 Tax=Rhizobium rhizogenes TaxID=359 RepID=UPI00157401F3|nr:hypothetical protein [Rhizobium rhizogenes]NTF67939.1 hypothetical protein [Rhizobium rhizogenes]